MRRRTHPICGVIARPLLTAATPEASKVKRIETNMMERELWDTSAIKGSKRRCSWTRSGTSGVERKKETEDARQLKSEASWI